MTAALSFDIFAKDPGSHARTGRVTTRNGHFDTPAFMPVGTQGTIKGVLPDHIAATGSQIILANTYHLMLRPTESVVRDLGGLHRFMSWKGPILTDSGGFQVFSLADISRITDDGVKFQSHIDGSTIMLTPRRSIEVQNALGADIIMAFDECPPGNGPAEVQRAAVERTVKWAGQCVAAHARPDEQSLFGIVQGGADPALRAECLSRLAELNFPGYALGGLAVGEGFEAMKTILEVIGPTLPADRPRYLMGVGFPRDIFAAVRSGMDMFDCVLPTRNGRNAYAFTADGPLRLRNSKLIRDGEPIEPGCDCYACRNFTRGAIRHFFCAGEMLGPVLASVHNMRFYQRLLADIRQAIAGGTFDAFCRQDPRAGLGPSSSRNAEE
jgi:queuine tRNA-ribosyltransferase